MECRLSRHSIIPTMSDSLQRTVCLLQWVTNRLYGPACLSFTLSLLSTGEEETWKVTSLTIPKDSFWGLKVAPGIFCEMPRQTVCLWPPAGFSDTPTHDALCYLDIFLYRLCLSCFAFGFVGWVLAKWGKLSMSFNKDIYHVTTLPFKRNLLLSRTKCKSNSRKNRTSPTWTFQYRWKSFKQSFLSHLQRPKDLPFGGC